MKGITREGFASRLSIAIIAVPVMIIILEFISRRIIAYLVFPLIDHFSSDSLEYLLLAKNIIVIGFSLWIIYFAAIWVKDGSVSFKKIFNGNDKTENKI